MSSRSIVISGVGVVSPVGRDAIGSCAAIRAGISRFRRVADYYSCRSDDEDAEVEPVVLAPAFDGLPDDRLSPLALGALRDLIASAGIARDPASWRLDVCLPAWMLATQPSEAFLRDLAARAGLPRIAFGSVTAGGQAGMLAATLEAARILYARQANACIVLGVGSPFDPNTLAALDAAERLKSERNRDGFIPGECATAILLERQLDAEKRGAAPLVVLQGAGSGHESQNIASGEPSSGQGLSLAIERAFSTAGSSEATPWAACDLNGESYRAREWGLVESRLPGFLNAVRTVWHPADCVGDVDAATGGLLIALVARAFARGYCPAPRALVWAASDDGLRSALILDKADGGGR